MTKLFLAAGVAALAITASASAAPGERAARADRTKAERAQVDRSAQRAQRTERRAANVERRSTARSMIAERPARVDRQAMRTERAARVETRQAARPDRSARIEARQQARVDRTQRVENRAVVRDQARADRIANRSIPVADVKAMPPGQAAKRVITPTINAATLANLRAARVDRLNRNLGLNLAAPATAVTLLGMPVSQANTILPLTAVPQSVSYLYPTTDDYYYRYGDGYMYQVDSGSNLISMLIPLLTGGYLPGQYLPASYMNSSMPSYYGFNSFYPNNPYECTRYANGMIYYVDCVTGMILNVVPVYNSGYGVGQMLPSSYGYYNVPSQYRDLYYDTSDYGYWYAPGAIYQYDQRSNMISSVAALLSPGMTIGQPMPMGYGAYNVPLSYRDTYYDTPNDWYRYSNGYIYRVDPTTQLVSAIVASILT